jgi:5'-deoxynucleotidase YfbR-like HD superfamily hydrolase
MTMTLSEFLSQIYNLAFVNRYSVIPRVKNESIAEHSFFVASLVVRLREDYTFDLGKAVTMATIHDWTESWTDDITVATKRKFPLLADAVEVVEVQVVKKYFPNCVKAIWLEYKECVSVESKIVKYADTLQVMQYAENEAKLGNKYMESVVEDAKQRLLILEDALHEYARVAR